MFSLSLSFSRLMIYRPLERINQREDCASFREHTITAAAFKELQNNHHFGLHPFSILLLLGSPVTHSLSYFKKKSYIASSKSRYCKTCYW